MAEEANLDKQVKQDEGIACAPASMYVGESGGKETGKRKGGVKMVKGSQLWKLRKGKKVKIGKNEVVRRSAPELLELPNGEIQVKLKRVRKKPDPSKKQIRGMLKPEELVKDHLPAMKVLMGELVQELKKSVSTRRLVRFVQATQEGRGAYPWQMAFYAAGAENRQRAAICANRVGKTYCIGAEIAFHLIGEYPEWWVGHRFLTPIDAIIAGTSNQDVRDIQQREMLGVIEDGRVPSGTGWIPKENIGPCSFRQCGVTNVVDQVQVRHSSGGMSSITFKSFEQGAIAYQGVSKHLVWMDEEPENDPNNEIFSEVMMRLMTSNGIFLFTRTPLFGRSAIINHFLDARPGTGIWHINVGWDQAPHLSESIKNEFMASVPEHQRDTRSKGVPLMGSGGVFNVPDEAIACSPFPIPEHFRRIVGIDFGIDHPAAAAWLAHDADTDTVYVYDCYKQSGQTAAYHADAITSRGNWIPVSWPHDGMIRDKGGGQALKDQYIAKGVNMLAIHACYSEDKMGAQPVEPGVIDMLERMRSGRFKVFRNLDPWFTEKRMYHRKDGVIVKTNDDIMSATRYGMMMLRCAVAGIDERMAATRPHEAIDAAYDPLESFSASRKARVFA